MWITGLIHMINTIFEQKYGDKLLLIQSQFGELDFVNGYFLMIPELESYDKLLESLGV